MYFFIDRNHIHCYTKDIVFQIITKGDMYYMYVVTI